MHNTATEYGVFLICHSLISSSRIRLRTHSLYAAIYLYYMVYYLRSTAVLRLQIISLVLHMLPSCIHTPSVTVRPCYADILHHHRTASVHSTAPHCIHHRFASHHCIIAPSQTTVSLCYSNIVYHYFAILTVIHKCYTTICEL